ncbi:hypothetical protein [Streptomyces sp. b94]|uniref:hypothetical protein n=1 Tax=Streptomyces sp. b94 TaxID=1827634 RepID=UPI0027DE2812|nr:hypothetical protein [Streptomyces sp. b94]
MTDTRTPPTEPGAALLRVGRFFRPGTAAPGLHSIGLVGGREADAFYRDRWSHDTAVTSPHGVNCTGSCRWNVFVKDGIITWETQATDYPSVGPDRPEYEPRGCPRGAAFSWYTYSPTRVRHPYVRGVLLEMYRLLAIAKYEERYVIPAAAVGDAHRLEASALPDTCSLDTDGGPGMGGDGPFGQDSGRKRLPLVPVENFHILRRRQTADDEREV